MLPMLGITGYSGSGKTTLLEKLLPALQQRNLRPAVIKHSHHNAQIMACDQRWALMTETPQSVSLPYLAQQFDRALTDFVLVEGFKQESIEKILLHRQGMTKPLPALDDYVLAVATDYSLACEKPVLDINHIDQIADFIVAWYQHKCGEI